MKQSLKQKFSLVKKTEITTTDSQVIADVFTILL